MLRNDIATIFVFLLLLSTAYAENTIESDYTLGRLIGGGAAFNATSLAFLEKGFVTADLYYGIFGEENKVTFGWTGLTAFGSNQEDGIFLLAFPEFDLQVQLGESNRIGMYIVPINLLLAIGSGGAVSGLRQPFYMVSRYHWNMLSKKGRISISEDQYEQSFYRGAFLNTGQIGINTVFTHSFRGNESKAPDILESKSTLRIGLHDNIQLSIYGRYRHLKKRYKDYETSNYKEKEYTIDTSIVSAIVETRLGSFFIDGGYGFSSTKDSSLNIFKHMLSLNAAYLFGKSVTDFTMISGNWDKFYSKRLGSKQLFTELGFNYNFFDTDISMNLFTLENRTRYGFFDWLTAGGSFGMSFGDYSTTSYKLLFEMVCMNVPRRTYGPSQASNFEYIFGYLPQKGQLILQSSINVPIQKTIYNYSQPQSIQKTISYELLNVINVLENIEHGTLYDRYKYPMRIQRGNILNDHDFYSKVSLGLADNVILTESFEFRVDNYDFIADSSSHQYKFDNLIEIEYNFIFANQFGITICRNDNLCYSFFFSIFGQTDDNNHDQKKVDFTLSGLLQAVF